MDFCRTTQKPVPNFLLHIYFHWSVYKTHTFYVKAAYKKTSYSVTVSLSRANRKMIEVSLYIAPAGDLGHDKDYGKTKNSSPWRVQNDQEVSSHTTRVAQEHLYWFRAKVHLTQCCVSNNNLVSVTEGKKRIKEQYSLFISSQLLMIYRSIDRRDVFAFSSHFTTFLLCFYGILSYLIQSLTGITGI